MKKVFSRVILIKDTKKIYLICKDSSNDILTL